MKVEQPGPETFLQLGDTPDSYAGAGSDVVSVTVGENGLAFTAGGGGSGTVTDFIFTNANGVSGSVLTSTTTPTLSISLGAITPTTIVASGAISGSNLSGTNTGDQTSIVGITGSLAEFNAALTGTDFATGGGVITGTSSGTNTGDQTSIVGITGTIAQFNTALTDGDFATGGGTVTGSSSGTNTGDQNLFQTIAVSGQSNVVADSTTDTLTLVAGTNITITTDAGTDSVTINAAGGGGGHVIQDEGTPLTQRANLNFVGAGVTVTDGGAGPDSTIVTINGGAGSFAVTETEVDFGTVPTTDKTFTVTDASITATSKIMVTESGSTGTGRVASGDSLWDSIIYSCVPATGSFTLFARASGAVVGFRKLYYTYS